MTMKTLITTKDDIIIQLNSDNIELLEVVKLCRKWYDNHGESYEIGLPNCFIKAKGIINKITNRNKEANSNDNINFPT